MTLTTEIVRQFSRKSRQRQSLKSADFDIDKTIQEKLLKIEVNEHDPSDLLFNGVDFREDSLFMDNSLLYSPLKPSKNEGREKYPMKVQALDKGYHSPKINSKLTKKKFFHQSSEGLSGKVVAYERSIGKVYEGYTGKIVNKRKREEQRKMKRLQHVLNDEMDSEALLVARRKNGFDSSLVEQYFSTSLHLDELKGKKKERSELSVGGMYTC